VRLYQTLSALFTPVYQSDSRLLPAIRDLVLGPLSRLPLAPRILASLVTGVLIDPFARIPLDRLSRSVGRTTAASRIALAAPAA
jgi:hypothetical protein